MDGVEAHQQRKGLVAAAADESHGFAGDGVSQKRLLRDGLADANDWIVGVVGRLVIAHVCGVDDGTELGAALLGSRQPPAAQLLTDDGDVHRGLQSVEFHIGSNRPG